jgi:hypothetical protein
MQNIIHVLYWLIEIVSDLITMDRRGIDIWPLLFFGILAAVLISWLIRLRRRSVPSKSSTDRRTPEPRPTKRSPFNEAITQIILREREERARRR